MAKVIRDWGVRLIAVLAIFPATLPAYATSTWCAVVRSDVDGGFLNIRGGPTAKSEILGKLYPGDYIEIDTAQCDDLRSKNGKVVGSVCSSEGSNWSVLEYVQSRRGPFSKRPTSWMDKFAVRRSKKVQGRRMERHPEFFGILAVCARWLMFSGEWSQTAEKSLGARAREPILIRGVFSEMPVVVRCAIIPPNRTAFTQP